MDNADLRTREDAMLARAAELCLSLAEHLHAEVLTAEPADKPALTKAMHTALRSLRQSIALRRKVEREDRQASQAVASAAISLRKAQVRAGVAALAWNEHEEPEYEDLLEALDEQLDADSLFDNFTTEPIEAHVDRLALAYGLTAPVPPPPGEGDREAVEGVIHDLPATHSPVIPESAQRLSGTQGPRPPPLDPGSPLQAARDDDEGWL